MKKVWFIARDDFLQIRSSVMVRIFMTLLISVPLFFTWFNVLATWDPFSNSNQLQIAVASTDKGYTSRVLNVNVNVGDIVLKELAVNDQFDWVVTSEDKALEGTRSGEYYAMIVLPEDFSVSMFTFYAGGATPANITLYTNEKKNPLSANLTAQGAQSVTAQINTAFSRALADGAVGIAEDVTSALDNQDTQAALDRLNNRLESLSGQLNAGANTVSSLSALAGSTIPLATGVNQLTAGMAESFNGSVDEALNGLINSPSAPDDPFAAVSAGMEDSLKQAALNVANVDSRLDDLLETGDSTVKTSAAVVEQLRDMLDKQIDGFQKTRDEIVKLIDSGETELKPDDPAVQEFIRYLDRAIASQKSLSQRMSDIAADLSSGVSVGSDPRDKARQAVADAKAAIEKARSNYSKTLKPQLDSLHNDLVSAGKNAQVFRSHLAVVQAQLSQSSSGMIDTMGRTQRSLSEAALSMRNGAVRLDQARQKIETTRNNGDLKEVATVLGVDPQGFARLLASPVAVERKAVFPVATFGVGMAPLFTIIALWVGSLLAGVFLRTEVSSNVGRRYLEAYGVKEDTGKGDDDAKDDGGENTGGKEADPEQESGGKDRVRLVKRESVRKPGSPARRPGGSAKKPVFSAAQEYLGRYVMFWVIGMAQSTLLMGGLIVFVGIKPAHPFLLILAGWVISTVFTNIIYTLVVALSNAGKAVAVVLLVLQISAAGGAYPLELLPQWFQNISPWLPATYAINLMRSAVAGIYAGDYAYNLGMLLVFILPNLLIGLVLRHAISGTIEKMTADIEKTKVM